jgi:hypothetical protein
MRRPSIQLSRYVCSFLSLSAAAPERCNVVNHSSVLWLLQVLEIALRFSLAVASASSDKKIYLGELSAQ